MLARLQVLPQGVEGGVEVTIADGKAAFRIIVRELEPAVHGGVFQMQRKAHPAVELAPFHMARGRDQVLLRELLGQPGADAQRLGQHGVVHLQRRHLAHRVHGEVGGRFHRLAIGHRHHLIGGFAFFQHPAHHAAAGTGVGVEGEVAHRGLLGWGRPSASRT